MRLYGAIQKVEPQDDGTVRVHGIASTEVVDDQGEIIRADAIRAAIPDYMRFPALREMHQLAAAGTTLEAEVGDDGATRIVAHVVDPVAVAKVKNQVYRGFSIGGRVTQREAGNPKAITGLVLDEISLVDRPANPEAVFDCWKASGAPAAPAGLAPFNPPIQIWACGVPDHHHHAKSEALKCLEERALAGEEAGPLQSAPAQSEASPQNDRSETEAAGEAAKQAIAAERAEASAEGRKPDSAFAGKAADRDAENYADPGYQPDGKPRYQVDTESQIRAAWSDINEAGNARRYSAEQVRQIRAAIIAAWKDKIDADGPPSSDPQIDGGSAMQRAANLPATAGDAPGTADVAALLETGTLNMRKLAAGLPANAEHSQGDQALADMALYACDKALLVDGLSAEDKAHVAKASEHLRGVGATSLEPSVSGMAGEVEPPTAGRGQQSRQPHDLIDIAHACLAKLAGGMTCSPLSSASGSQTPAEEIAMPEARQSAEAMEQLRAAHGHLVAAGAECDDTSTGEDEPAGTEFAWAKASRRGDLGKVLADERAEKAALVKALGEMVPLLDRLSKRVDDIARTPLPPRTIAKGTISVSKEQDGSGVGDSQLSPEAIAAALAKMSKEDQTLTLIKASYANPIRVLGAATGEG